MNLYTKTIFPRSKIPQAQDQITKHSSSSYIPILKLASCPNMPIPSCWALNRAVPSPPLPSYQPWSLLGDLSAWQDSFSFHTVYLPSLILIFIFDVLPYLIKTNLEYILTHVKVSKFSKT